MNKRLLHRIDNLAMLTFKDTYYNLFMHKIKELNYNSARVWLDFWLDKHEKQLELDYTNEELRLECINIDKLLDLVIELIILDDKKERRRRRRKQTRQVA